MFQYRSVLAQIRRGASDRELARSHTMGRRKLAQFRALAAVQGWLDAEAPLPDEAQIAAALEPAKQAASTVSSLESHRQRIQEWLEQSVPATAILAALKRNHGYPGSYSSLYRMIVAIRGETPPAATVPLAFAPGEAAQVDFGAGPKLLHPDGSVRRTWAFVMTLCLEPPPVRRVRLGPDGGNLAGLPPPRLRMVHRGAQAAGDRQRQVRHQQGLHP